MCVCVCVCECSFKRREHTNITTHLTFIIPHKLTFEKFMRELKQFPLKSADLVPGIMYAMFLLLVDYVYKINSDNFGNLGNLGL